MTDVKETIIFFYNQPHGFKPLALPFMLGGKEYPGFYGNRFFIRV